MNRNKLSGAIMVAAMLFAGACRKDGESAEGEAASDAVSREVVSTKIVMRLTREGTAEIVDVIEQPGVIPTASVLGGDYVYEVREGSSLVAVESFGDPFELRAAFEGEGDHAHIEAPAATVIVRLPGVAARGRSLDVRVHKLTRAPGVGHLDGPTFESLQRSGAFAQVARVSPETLGPRLSHARRLPERVRVVEQ